MAKILVVEDDRFLAAQIAEALKEIGYLIDVANTGADAISYSLAAQYDLIVLDWELPDVAGPDLCRELRVSRGIQVPVIFLTARVSIRDKDRGFSSGADDYLTKPFEMTELLLRIKALLRRQPIVQPKRVKIRNIMLDMESREVWQNGEKIDLFPKEYALLEFFVCHPNQTFSVDTLRKRIWPTDSDSSVETVRVTLMRVRQKLDTGDQEPLIITLKNIGYRLEA